jgi:glycosyltransferase involved in cell wall biosynthesis
MLGYRVIFAAVHDFPSHVVYRDNLSARGVHCLGPDDGQSIQSFIEEHGEAISLFMLVRGGAGGQYLELIRYNSPSAKIVFYTIDLHFLREERQARLLNDAEALKAAGRTRDWEQSLVKKSDATIVVSTAEQSLVTAAVPGSYVVNLPLCRVDQPPASPFDSRRDIGFVGGFAHLPNVDAVQYFLTEIWPLVHAELPDCRFSIVGADLPADVALGLPAGAQYLGHVQDLEAWLGALRLTVAPLRFGAGMKGKVVSSLAAGVPCVSTSIGVEGMSVVAGEDILVADTPEGIAGELVRAYRDPELWTMLSRNGQSRMQQGNSISGYRRSVHEMLVHIGLPCITPP